MESLRFDCDRYKFHLGQERERLKSGQWRAGKRAGVSLAIGGLYAGLAKMVITRVPDGWIISLPSCAIAAVAAVVFAYYVYQYFASKAPDEYEGLKKDLTSGRVVWLDPLALARNDAYVKEPGAHFRQVASLLRSKSEVFSLRIGKPTGEVTRWEEFPEVVKQFFRSIGELIRENEHVRVLDMSRIAMNSETCFLGSLPSLQRWVLPVVEGGIPEGKKNQIRDANPECCIEETIWT